MSFRFDKNNGVQFYRGSTLVLDSTNQNAVIGYTKSGTFNFNLGPSSTLPFTGVARVENVSLQTGLSTRLTHVDGTCRATWSGGAFSVLGVIDGAYHNIGGTVIVAASNENMYPDSRFYQTYLTGPNEGIASCVALTFKVENGTFSVDVDRYIPGYGNGQPLAMLRGTITVSYTAYLLTFDN